MNIAEIWIPLVAVILHAGSTIYNKMFFNQSKIPTKDYLVYSSIWLAILTLPVTFFAGSIDVAKALEPKYVLLLIGVIGLAIVANWWTYKGFRESNLLQFDLIAILQPLVVVTLAGLLIVEERDPRIWLIAAICFGALFFAHLRHNHVQFTKGERLVLLGTFSWGLHEVLVRFLLDVYSPAMLYFIRVSILTVIFIMMFKVPLRKLTGKFVTGSFVSAVLTVGCVLLTYYAYQIFGVTVTNVIGLFYPIIIYAAATEMFGIKEPKRMLLAAIVILLSLGYLMLVVL